ncbi:hypothetical protein [Kordia sp.]|uniref:hypothetical protein n=1 Tax=Kordia sp. TaxID=1965332 RepID=UPI003D6A4E4B
MKKLKSISEFSKNTTVKKLNIGNFIYGGYWEGRVTFTNYEQTGPDKLHDYGDMDGDYQSPSEPASDSPVN